MNYLLLGRPNVGKSSIFNILTKTHSNIIHKESGTTRDWHKGKIVSTYDHFIYDTPGVIYSSNKVLSSFPILEKILSNIDIIVFVIDFKSSFNPVDNETIKSLRKYNKKILLVINKTDNLNNISVNDYYKYNIKNIFFLSCSHKYGFDVFIKFINSNLSEISNNKSLNDEMIHYSLAIFGKPNSGKSTFLNTLLGYERSFTSTKAGTTSDYVTEIFNYKSHKIKIYDTAGIGRKSKIKDNSINYYSIKKTFEKIIEVNAALILIDSTKGFDRQDKRIVNLISKYSKSLIIIFNKQDLINNLTFFKKEKTNEIKSSLHQIKNIKILFCSAFSKKQIYKILEYVYSNILTKKIVLSTSKLNNWLKNAVATQSHPMVSNKKIKFKYVVKVKDSPITIKIFCNNPIKIKKDYKRFLINNFNNTFKILNQNTKIVFSKSDNPYK